MAQKKLTAATPPAPSGKDLIIVESPAKAKTIGKFLDHQYTIRASMGHVRDLPKKDLGVDVENGFKPKYEIDRSRNKAKIIKELRDCAEAAGAIYLASDHDREGEAIAWHLAEMLHKEIGKKPVYRIVFNEITRNAIREAMQHPGRIDLQKVDAQQTRRILDRIVGYKISPLLWKVLAGNLSAGRVQSVALRLICEREQEITAFVPREYWTIDIKVRRDDLLPFGASLDTWAGAKPELATQAEALAIVEALNGANYLLAVLEPSSRTVQPPTPFITSTLQQDASRVLNMSPTRTMSIAQNLYEGVDLGGETVGLISYMRTDSLRVSEEAIASCRTLISERFGKESLNPTERHYKNKSSAQDAHEAIRPTDCHRTPESVAKHLNPDQLRLYTLIWQRFVATQMAPVLLDTVNLKIEAVRAVFTSSGGRIVKQGFLQAYPHTKVSTGEEIDGRYCQGDKLELVQLDKNQHFTKPPARFTEASLIKELESNGIGRPSTYASITQTILERTYVELKEKRFHPTTLGTSVNTFLVKQFERLFNVEFTADMENRLDEIEFGKQNWQGLLGEYYASILEQMKGVDVKETRQAFQETTDILCEKCGHPMVVKWGKRGQFLACSNYPECSNIKRMERSGEGKAKVAETEEWHEPCPDCGGKLLIKSGRFGKFIACANYPKCKFAKPLPTGVKCPQCGEGDLTAKKGKMGRTFYSCTRYPDCKYLTNYKPVPTACANCGNAYLEERRTKDRGVYLHCLKCGTEYETGNKPDESGSQES
jgi:DNA topoisomerase I